MSMPGPDKLRTRWRRWLGNKTRAGKHTWVDLLDSNWAAWPGRVLGKHGIDEVYPRWQSATRELVKAYWLKAIDVADADELMRLDGLYCDEQVMKER